MKNVGLVKKLKISKIVDIGAYLDNDGIEVLIPEKYLPENYDIGDFLEVFLYTDSEDRIIATTLTPFATLGELAILEVVDKNDFGCFLNLGIAKDIFMPTKKTYMYPISSKVCVFIDRDKEGRLIARGDIKSYCKSIKDSSLKYFQSVSIVPFRKTNLGYECIINKQYLGLIYNDEVYDSNFLYRETIAYIKKIYPNGKCDLSLKQPLQKKKSYADDVLYIVKQHGGEMNFNYDSSPEDIAMVFKISKKSFKKSLSELISDNKIELTHNNSIKLR